MMSVESRISRRRFIDLTAGTVLLAGTSARARVAAQSPGNQVRMGLIGAGNRGSQVAAYFLNVAEYAVIDAALARMAADDLAVAAPASPTGVTS